MVIKGSLINQNAFMSVKLHGLTMGQKKAFAPHYPPPGILSTLQENYMQPKNNILFYDQS